MLMDSVLPSPKQTRALCFHCTAEPVNLKKVSNCATIPRIARATSLLIEVLLEKPKTAELRNLWKKAHNSDRTGCG